MVMLPLLLRLTLPPLLSIYCLIKLKDCPLLAKLVELAAFIEGQAVIPKA
jgi:hypothetical protein